MAWTKIVFKLACPEPRICEPNPDGLALVAEFNERLLPFEDDQQVVRAAFEQIDIELVNKYSLKLNVHVQIDRFSERTFFKIACAEFLDGERNIEGLALALDINEKIERLNLKEWEVERELETVDEELVKKYQLTIISVTECRT